MREERRMATDKTLATEQAIVWLEDCQAMRYIRESVGNWLHDRQRKPSWHNHAGRLVAYAVLRPDTQSDEYRMFTRRYWWLADHDPYADGGQPMEAVDPTTVQAGRHSRYPKEPT